MQFCRVQLLNKQMKAQQKTKYIQKTYEIYIRTICLKDQLQLIFCSSHSAKQHSLQGQIVLNINKVFSVTTIDSLSQIESKVDKDVALNLLIREMSFEGLVFDMNIQKLIKQTKTIFRKQLRNKKGFVDYRFVGCKTKLIQYQSFREQNINREKVLMLQLEDSSKLKKQLTNKSQKIKEKDAIISNLNLSLLKANAQISNLRSKLQDQFQKFKQGMNIKVRVSSNTPTGQSKEHQRLLREKDGQVKFLHSQLKKMQLQMALMQDLNGYGSEERSSDESVMNRSHLTKRLDHSKFFSSSEQSDDPQQICEFQKDFSIHQSRSNSRHSREQHLSPHSNILQVPTFAQNRESKISQKHNNSIITSNNNKIQQSNIAKLIEKPQKLKSSSLHRQNPVSQHRRSMSIKAIPDPSNKNNTEMLKQMIEGLKGQFELQRQQKLFLKEQNVKKAKQIQRMLKTIAEGQKQKLDFQKEKGRLLQMFARKLSLGDREQGVKVLMKQMTAFNKNNEKENANLIKENAKLNKRMNSQLKKYQSLELGYSQCVLKITQLNKQISCLQEKASKKMIDMEISADFLSLKQQEECEHMKLKLQENETQISNIKESSIQIQKLLQEKMKYLEQLQATNQTLLGQNEILKLQLNRVAIKSIRGQKIESNYNILIENYEQLLGSLDELKLKLIKVEHHYNKNVKHDDLVLYQQEMDKIIIVMFREVGRFQKEFYSVLLLTNQVALESQTNYYDKFIKNQQLYLKQGSQAQKNALLREKEMNLARIKAKSAELQQKINIRMKSLEQQILSFEEGVKTVEGKLCQLQKFKEEMYSFLRSLNIDHSQFVSLKQSTNLKNSVLSKGKLSIDEIEILEVQGQDQQDKKSEEEQNAVTRSTLKHSQPNRRQAKKSGLQSSNKFELTKLKHTIAIKRSFLNESANIVASKVFGLLKESAEMNVGCHELIAAKREMSLERMNIRDRELRNFQHSSQMVKNIDNLLFDEKIEKDRLILQYQKRQKALQHQFQKIVKHYEAKVTQLTDIIKDKQNQISSLEQQKEKIAETVNQLQADLLIMKSQGQEGTQYILALEDERDKLKEKLGKLQKVTELFQYAEMELIHQVEKIKDFSKLNEVTLKQLIEERNNKFEEVQLDQRDKINEMAKTIDELQTRIREQAQEYMFNRSNFEYVIDRKNQYIDSLTSKIQDLENTLQNLTRQLQMLSYEKNELQSYNQQYQRNLHELGRQIEEKQQQILQKQAMIRKIQKQLSEYMKANEEMEQNQRKHKEEFISYLDHSKLQVRRWSQQFAKLQSAQQKIKNQSNQREIQKQSLQSQIKALSELVKKRQSQVLRLQKQAGEKQCHIRAIQQQKVKMQYEYDCITRKNSDMERLIQTQKQQIEQLSEYKQSKKRRKKSFNIHDLNKSFNLIQHEQTPIRKYGNFLQAQAFTMSEPQEPLELQQKLNDSQSSLYSEQNLLHLMVKQNEQLKSQQQLQQGQMKQMQKVLLKMKGQSAQKDEQIGGLKSRMTKLEERIVEKQQNIQKLIAELLIHQKEIGEQSRQIERLTKSLKIKEICKLNQDVVHKQLVSLKCQNTQLKSFIGSLETTATQKSTNLKNTVKYLELSAQSLTMLKRHSFRDKYYDNLKQSNLISIRDFHYN